MRMTVLWGHMGDMRQTRHVLWRHTPDDASAAARDLDEDVRWAWGLMAFTLPAGLVAVLLVDGIAALTALSATGLWAGVVVYAAVVAPLVASVVVGFRAWRAAGETLALRAALLSAGMIAVGSALVLGVWLS